MDGIEKNDFVMEFDAARAKDTGTSVPIVYSGHLLLPGDDVVVALMRNGCLETMLNGQPADATHQMAELVGEYATTIRRALKRNFDEGATRREIIGRWHENGDEYAFEPYLVRTTYADKPPVVHKYRYGIFPLDGYKLGDDFSVEFTSRDPGKSVKAALENSTEIDIHYDELPKSMFSWMPVGVVWTPPKKLGYPVLVEYAVGKERRRELRALRTAA